MESYIKKSELIKNFKELTKTLNLSIDEIEKLDKPFFEIINRVYKTKALDIKFYITKQLSIAFKIEYSENKIVYIEHFIGRKTKTLVSFSLATDNFDTKDDIMLCENLDDAITKVENFIKK